MFDAYVKRIFVEVNADEVAVKACIPGSEDITIALANIGQDGEFAIAALAQGASRGEAAELVLTAFTKDLVVLSDAELAQAEALASAESPCAGTYLIAKVGRVDEAALLQEFSERAAVTGPGVLPTDSCFEIKKGAAMVKGSGSLPWSSIPPDEAWGDCAIDAVADGQFRMVMSRQIKALPTGSATDVTCSRGAFSVVKNPNWTINSGEHPIGKIRANILSGRVGNATFEWVEGGNTQSVSKTACRVDYSDSPHTMDYTSPLGSLSSDVEWDGPNALLLVTDPA